MPSARATASLVTANEVRYVSTGQLASCASGIMERIADFVAFRFSHNGVRRKVCRAGTGPAVIVMPEVPGLSDEVLRFAKYVVDARFTVYLPHLSGAELRRCDHGPATGKG